MTSFRFSPLRSAHLALFVGCMLAFASRTRAGSIARLFYDDIAGTAVAALTNSPGFPEAPTFREQLDDFTVIGNNPLAAGLQGKDNSGTQFGSWVRGYLEAPATGQYVFSIASDDASELWLGTDHLEHGKRRIAFETGTGAPLFGGPRLADRQSLPVGLIRGQRYYLEILHKQATGASFLQVGWRRPDGVQEIVPALHLAQHPLDPYAGRSNPDLPPVFNPHGLNSGDLTPESVVDEGGDLLLQLDVIAAQPTTIRWLRNDEIIPGEDLSFLRLRRVPSAFADHVVKAIVENRFGSVTSTPTVLRVTADSRPPVVTAVDTAGNPNLALVRFSEPVREAGATNLDNFEVRRADGSTLPVRTASLLPDDRTVRLSGDFGFRADGSYSLVVRGIQDRATRPNSITPDPSITAFAFGSGSGIAYDFDSGRPGDVRFFGSAKVVPSGGPNGSGFLELTDAFRNRNGAVLFSERRDIDQVRIRFKARLGDGSEAPAEGFSVNIANDLPLATLPTPEDGYLAATPGDRLSFAFDTAGTSVTDPSAISIRLNDVVLTNILTGVAGVPAPYSESGRWVDYDLDVRRGGKISIRLDGVTVLDRFATDFEIIRSAQIGLAARTTTSWQSHWFDDVVIGHDEGDLGNVAIPASSELGDRGVDENDSVRFAVLPTGASPYKYQWLRDGRPLDGETNRVLRFAARLDSGGDYAVAVSNDFSGAVSSVAKLVVRPDLAAPRLVSVRGVAGGIREVRLHFDEALDPETATRVSTYSSPILRILSATLTADGHGVVLSTSGQRAGFAYAIEISGLRDLAAAGNILNDRITFVSSINYEEEVLSDKPSRFWRFEERTGTTAASSGSSRDSAVHGTYAGAPALGIPALVPTQTNGAALGLASASGQRVTVPNGSDINAGGPWTKKSFEFWFRPSAVPEPGASGLQATKGIYEQGAAARGIMFYLWRDPTNADPNTAELVFHAFNSASDGPGAPFGQTGLPPVYVKHTVRVGETHHVVGVFDGSSADRSGELRLYVDGVLVGRASGVGQIYAHTGDVQIGRGNVLVHTGVSGDLGFFDGALDEFALFASVLSEERVLAHYHAGIGKTTAPTNPPVVLQSVETRGNPNLVRLAFSQPISAESATNPVNYSLTTSSGTTLPIRSATLLADLATVEVRGAFDFQVGGRYVVTVRDIADQLDATNVLRPNPTTVDLPFAEGGPVAIGPDSLLEDRTVVENLSTRFVVAATGAKPYSYQWSFEGTPISGATNPVLDRIASSTTAGRYTVTVKNEFSEVTSAPARLVLQTDTVPPHVTSIRAVAGTVNEVRLALSEPLDPGSATNLATYRIPGLAISAVTLASNAVDVVVKTSTQTNGAIYQVTIEGLRDRATVPNALNLTLPVLSRIGYRDEIIADGAVRYYPFSETEGTRLETLVSLLDARTAAAGTASANPGLSAPSLLPNLPDDGALGFDAGRSNRVTLPNGSDLNVTAGPWSERTFAFAFRAESLPRGGATPEAPPIFEEGANSRGFAFYLYGTQDLERPTEALLVVHGWNNVSADGAGSPWGAAQNSALSAAFVATPIKAGETYHVVVVFDGDAEDTTGQLRLFLDGRQVGVAGGVGQIYNHSGDISLGQSSSYLLHDGRYITSGGAYFDGVLDELAVVGRALDSARIAQLYEFSRLVPPRVAPTLALVEAVAVAGSVNEVRLAFNDKVDPVTGSNVSNFRVGDLSVLSAAVSADAKTIVLRTSPQSSGQPLNLAISGLKDALGLAPALATQRVVTPTLSYVSEILADGPVRYYGFGETSGTNIATRVTVRDSLASGIAAVHGAPTLGVPGLVPTLTDDPSIRLVAAQASRLLVPNGTDLNITSGPWAKRTLSLWFKAERLPRGGGNPEALVLWEEGGDSRGAAIYLYGTQDVDTPDEALLVWNAYNNASADGPGSGWGVALGKPEQAVYVSHPVRADTVYNVVAVLDGDAGGTSGTLSLYVDGRLVGTKSGAGQIYNHSANVQIGRGAFVRHDGITAGDLHYFDGTLDELAVFNQAIPARRIGEWHAVGVGASVPVPELRLRSAKDPDGRVVLTWEGTATLQRATSVQGPFVEVPTSSPGRYEESVVPGSTAFFRLRR